MANPLVKKDLVDAILELRADVEKQLQANKFYVALGKLDELLAAIRPLETAEARAEPQASSRQEAPPAPPAEPEAERSWSGIVHETIVEGEAARPA
jgi:hypothetical protein